ncbi:MAG: c-type cytochrome [Gammaproteobacteria bacterium]|nr:c-type cytochrome [Gammaproteobacteria bacterium]
MRYSTTLAILCFGLSAFASTSVSALSQYYEMPGNAANGEQIFKSGKGDVPACISCHGEEGLGDDAMGTPRLAGQGYKFLVKQLSDFATDKRQDTTMFIMNTNAKGLSAEDHQDLALYLTMLKKPDTASDMKAVKELGTTPVGVRYKGKIITQYGIPERDVPACHSCHGYNGRGAFPMYPRLLAQRYTYLVSQLKKWRDGSRNNDSFSQMQIVAQKLTDEDIYNVATFLTSAPESTLGNRRVPDLQ